MNELIIREGIPSAKTRALDLESSAAAAAGVGGLLSEGEGCGITDFSSATSSFEGTTTGSGLGGGGGGGVVVSVVGAGGGGGGGLGFDGDGDSDSTFLGCSSVIFAKARKLGTSMHKVMMRKCCNEIMGYISRKVKNMIEGGEDRYRNSKRERERELSVGYLEG